jgi:hypothetical protein
MAPAGSGSRVAAWRSAVRPIVLTGAITRQLLTFSRKQVVVPRILDPDDLIAKLLPLLRRLIGEAVELCVRGTCGGAKVRVDPGQLEQVIVNLVVNARDARSRDGLPREAVLAGRARRRGGRAARRRGRALRARGVRRRVVAGTRGSGERGAAAAEGRAQTRGGGNACAAPVGVDPAFADGGTTATGAVRDAG